METKTNEQRNRDDTESRKAFHKVIIDILREVRENIIKQKHRAILT